MNESTRKTLNNLWSQDRQLQNKAFHAALKLTDKKVPWVYEAWDELKRQLTDKDNHNRAIAAQILCNLAKSDPKKRMLRDLKALLATTKDERFVTARHCMQSLWKVGAAGKEQRALLLKGLTTRFKECIKEKNGTLIRYDISQSLRNVYDATKDQRVKATALTLIETEKDLKYRKKYASLWRSA